MPNVWSEVNDYLNGPSSTAEDPNVIRLSTISKELEKAKEAGDDQYPVWAKYRRSFWQGNVILLDDRILDHESNYN